MTVTIKPGVWVDLAEMVRRINRSGFKGEMTGIAIVATGQIQHDGETYRFILSGMKKEYSFALTADEKLEGGTKALQQMANKAVRIEARWMPPAQDAPGEAAGVFAVTKISPEKGK